MSSTPTYNIPPSATQPDDIWIKSKNLLLKNREYAYPYLLGSKTGFVSQSRQTLVSGAQKDGIKLVCVVFKEESPAQFEDTVKLFEYGFENFKKLMIDDYETKYSIDNLDLFETGNDLFGDSTPLMSMERDSYIIVPSSVSFEDVSSKVTYPKKKNSNVIATIEYTYSDICVGTCDITFSNTQPEYFDFSTRDDTTFSDSVKLDTKDKELTSPNVIFINVNIVIIGFLIFAGFFIFIMILLSVLSSYSFSPRGQSNKRRRQRNRESRIAKREAFHRTRRQRKQIRQKRKAYKKRKHSSFRRTYD